MGISGLLPFLKKCSRPANLSEFKDQVAAIDTYCWIHKGAFSCADKLVLGEKTDRYVLYVMKLVNLLLSFNIKPILVFDGCHLPAKAGTEGKRRENRATNKIKAKEMLRQGKLKEARDCFQKCVDVTSEMAHEVIKACRSKNVDIIVAPYEADAQLAYLNHIGIADFIITEDSDLVLFGCDKILFKMDSNGGGNFVEKEKLHLAMNVPRDKFSFTKFQNMCVLSGCDYLPSLKGIGLGKACRFFNTTSNPDVYNALCKLPSNLKMLNLEVTQEYRDGFMMAVNTVLHQLVFDPISRLLKPLTPFPEGSDYSHYPYCGKFIGHEKALQIALGNVNVQTGKQVDNYDPIYRKVKKTFSTGWFQKDGSDHPSIWDSGDKFDKEEFKKLLNPNVPQPKTLGKELIVDVKKVKLKNLKRKEPEVDEDGISEQELHSLYFQTTSSSSKRKVRRSTPSPTKILTVVDPSPPSSSEISDPSISVSLEVKTEVNLYKEISPKGDKSHLNPFVKTLNGSFESEKKNSFTLKNSSMKSHVVVHSRYFSPKIKDTKSAVTATKSPNSFRSSSSSFDWKSSTATSIFDTPPSSQNKENFQTSVSQKTSETKKDLSQSPSPVFHRKPLKTSTPAAPPVCRVSGLKKPKQKQLNLREMFGFKK